MIYTGGYAQGFIDSPTRELALLVYTGGFKPGLLANLMDKLPPGLLDVDYVTSRSRRMNRVSRPRSRWA